MLSEQLAAFARAVLDPNAPEPTDPVGALSVYRNNHRIGLTDALAENFPLLAKLVGPDWFAQAARAYVAAHPPRAASLAVYGDAFAAFLERLPPEAACPPWAADVARFEWAWLSSWSAEDAPAFTAAAAAATPPKALCDLVLPAHGAARLIASPWPLTALRDLALADPAEERRVDLDAGGERLLITRPALEVMIHPLSLADYAFFVALTVGAPLGVAAAQAGPELDLAAALALGLRAGAWRG